MIRIAGVVIFFNPSLKFIDNIKSYINQVETLFALDNSESPTPEFVNEIKQFKNVHYKWNGGNVGVANALNIGVKLAIEQKYDFLLMMDQDSVLSENVISESIKYISDHSSKDIGILYPYHVYGNYFQQKEVAPFKEILVADTSGSVLNVEAYSKVGPFLDKLFIDYVDFEYCLRLRLNGFKIIQLNHITLYQELGNMVTIRILFWKVGISNHSPQRIYYRVRNRLFVSSKYFIHFPIWSIMQMAYLWIEFGKIVLFEDNKILKCKMIMKGVMHFLSNNYAIFMIEN
jgi:rhamnosyltransferase